MAITQSKGDFPLRAARRGRGMSDRRFIILIAASQLFCAIFLIGDVASEAGYLWQAAAFGNWVYSGHLIGEAAVVVLLFVGFLASRAYERRLHADATFSRQRLHLLRHDFDAIIQDRFRQWQFSPAERDVGLLALRGMTLGAIATARGVAEGTVKAQLHQVLRKAGVGSRSEFIAMVMDELLHDEIVV